MAIKTHLADSAEPLKEGVSLTAICGAVVPDAAFVFMWDDVVDIDLLLASLKGCCRQCTREFPNRTGCYLYGIRSGEENKQATRGEGL